MTQPPRTERHPHLLLQLADQRELAAGLPPPAQWLTATEHARWEAFQTAPRRLSFLAGRWLARQAVARWSGSGTLPALGVAPSGACVVADGSGVFVSLSHHADAVVCAVAAVPVGVDIESPRRQRDVLALSGMVDSPAQQAALAELTSPTDLPPGELDRQFLRHWTLKEAWLKARQQGLDFALMRALEFEEAQQASPSASPGVDGADTAVAQHGDFIIALAGVPSLPQFIDAPPGMVWRRYRSRLGASFTAESLNR